MTANNKIAFIRLRDWPLANVRVKEIVINEFSEFEVDTINVGALIKRHPFIIFVNILQIILYYGKDVLLGHKKIRAAFWHTPYIFNSIKKLLTKRLSRENYLFTFQMQSIVDCSIPNTPHFVYTDHTHLANLTYRDYNLKKLYRQEWIDLEKKIYQNASLVFVRSSNILDSLVEQYGIHSEKIKCVFSGSNVVVNEISTTDKDYSNQNILFVGLEWERKGGPELIEAFKIVLKKFPKATLTIVGANPQIQVPNTKIIGKVSPGSLINYYKEASIFCLPTRLEPFGIAFLEAMQARLPIIGTNIGAVPDFVEDSFNGLLVEPGDINGISNALIKLLEQPENCRIYGERSKEIADNKYNWQAVGKRIKQHIINQLNPV